jgi:hypothetical protein
MKYLKIRIELGTSDSVFDIYYDSVSSGTRALLYDTGLPAIGLTNEVLEFGEGVTVSVPDNATSIILSSNPAAFCAENPDVNDETYTILIGCMSYTVSASLGIFNYFYTDCDCNPVTATIDATYGYTEQTFCALQDSVSAGPLTVIYNGYCGRTGFPIDLCYDSSSASSACECVQPPDIVMTYIGYGKRRYASESDVITSPNFITSTIKIGSTMSFMVRMRAFGSIAFDHQVMIDVTAQTNYSDIEEWFNAEILTDTRWINYKNSYTLNSGFIFDNTQNVTNFFVRPWRNGTASRDIITDIVFNVTYKS